MEKPLVSIIIVNWNGKEYLKKCLLSLKKQLQKGVEIIIVDNSSNDDSVEFVKKEYPKTKLIVNDRNLGFAQANNIGFNICVGKYILFLNNDTKVTPDFLVPLIRELASNVNTGGVQSKILLMDGSKKLDSIGAFFTNTGFLYHYGFRKQDLPKFNKKIDLYSAKGACMLFKRSVLEKVLVDGEVFDSRYFAYFEETDLCHRVWLAGFCIKYISNSLVYHHVGATSSGLGDEFIQYHSFKNRIDSYIKNLGIIYLIKVLPLHILLCMASFIFYIFRGKPVVSMAIVKAIVWNIVNIHSTLYKRMVVQSKIRKIKDKIFLPGLTKKVGINYFISHFRGLEKYSD